MKRRSFLKGVGVATIVVASGGVWRAYDQGVFRIGEGPAYEPWKNWRDINDGPLTLVRAAILAASPHNTQPWLFRVADSSIEMHINTQRNVGALDPYLREEHIGVGCALENLMLAAPANGYAATATLLWYFPAGFPHSLQGIGPEGTEFLLVFNSGDFSEADTFLISETLVHTPPEVVKKNMGWSRDNFDKLPQTELYIFGSQLPGSLEADRQALGDKLETKNKYTYKLSEQKPNTVRTGGSVKIVDVDTFLVADKLCAAQVTLKPGGIREMHWHPHSSEWQYYIQGKGRMTVVTTGATARTMDFSANDVGFVPIMATHYVENTGAEDLIFLEMLRAPHFIDVSVNAWIAALPDNLAVAHTKLPLSVIRSAPQSALRILPK